MTYCTVLIVHTWHCVFLQVKFRSYNHSDACQGKLLVLFSHWFYSSKNTATLDLSEQRVKFIMNIFNHPSLSLSNTFSTHLSWASYVHVSPLYLSLPSSYLSLPISSLPFIH